jgi:hypothetical protein
MMRCIVLTCVSLLLLLHAKGQSAGTAPFSGPEQTGELQDKQLREASGITASRLQKNCYWLHNDSGDEARLFLMQQDGEALGIARFKEQVWDCEDIASGIGYKKGTYVYLGDIGDNLRIRSAVYVYIFKENDLLQAVKENSPVKRYTRISLHYPDGPRDAETLMVDPVDSLLYIVSKREPAVHVYSISLKALFTQPEHTLQLRAVLPHTYITAGDISASGREILLKNYDSVFYWKRTPGEPVFRAMEKNAVLLPYKKEKQGEAIAFTTDATGFITTSEGKHAPVYVYKRNR